MAMAVGPSKCDVGAPVRRHAGALLVLLAILGGCSLGEGERYYGVFVHGTVSSEAGSALSGVNVRIAYTANEECAAPFTQMVSEPTTDSTGFYGLTIVETHEPQVVCVKVVATPPTGLSLAADSALLADVQLTEGLGTDSVRIDLVLPPVPTRN